MQLSLVDNPRRLTWIPAVCLRMRHVVFAFIVLASAGTAIGFTLHPNSLSRSRVTVDGSVVTHELRLQVASVLEVVDADSNGDGRLDKAELADSSAELAAYLARNYQLVVDGGGVRDAGRILDVDIIDLAPDAFENGAFIDHAVRVVRRATDRAPVTDLTVRVSLFHDTSPAHRDFCTLVWNAEEQPLRVFSRLSPQARFARVVAMTIESPTEAVKVAMAGSNTEEEAPPGSTGPGDVVIFGGRLDAFASFVRLGVHHILLGFDHLAFLLALIVAARAVWSLVGVVTAFTVAHSVTLALSAFGVVALPGRVVEAMIALSIVVVGVQNLIFPRPHGIIAMAFVFGLLHGLGFASVLSGLLADGRQRILALVGFNLGVELGQLAVVALVVAMLVAIRRVAARPELRRGAPLALAPPRVVFACSLAVTLAGAGWLVERTLLA